MKILGLLFLFGSYAFGFDMTPAEPKAMTKEKVMEKHGHQRTDPYFWLKERESKEVLDYLQAENKYLDSVMKPLKSKQMEIFEELKARTPGKDDTAPYYYQGYMYYQRYETGKEYPFYCRRKGSMKGVEEILIDANKEAEGKDYFRVGGAKVSDDQRYLAYAVDTQGRRKYDVLIRELSSNKTLPNKISMTSGSVVWSADSQYIFFTKKDPKTLRSFQVVRHRVKDAQESVVYTETDDTFYSYIYRTSSGKYFVIGSESTLSNELRILTTDNPTGSFKVFHPREADHLYEIDHMGDEFFVMSNYKAPNYQVFRTPLNATNRKDWKLFVKHRDTVYIDSIATKPGFLILEERESGFDNVVVLNLSSNTRHRIDFDETVYDVGIGQNPDHDQPLLRINYDSMTTPSSYYDVNLKTHTKTLVKRDKVGGVYDPEQYETKRIYARARDGIAIPITMVYKKGFRNDGKSPFLLMGYGAYGSTIPPYFSLRRLSLLNRGFGFGIAHIRGGQIFGRKWYEDGRLLNKMNSFTDFIDAANHLVRHKYAAEDKIFALGGSAGGLLMGGVMNMAPKLFAGVVASVPFVDVLTTMLDDTIPLTTFEYDEWGNPNEKKFYDYMAKYSPYDNVTKQDYPPLLVTAGLHDSQVQYWEPAKWVARLRALRVDKRKPLLLKTNMDAGHGGKSGRYRELEETAMIYAFLLKLAEDKSDVN